MHMHLHTVHQLVICPRSCFPSDNLIPSLNSKKGEQQPLKAERWSWKQTFRIRAQRKLANNQDVLNPFWSVKGEYSYHPLGREQACRDWMDYVCFWATVRTHTFLPACGWLNYSPFQAKAKIWCDNWEKQPLSCPLSFFLHFCGV